MEELATSMLELFRDKGAFVKMNPLFAGVPDMLSTLSGNYRLAVVSQNFSEANLWMKWHGIHQFFDWISLSSSEDIYKPDPRLFKAACDGLEVSPEDCIMVGDRLDNDIWPANRLRMKTVRVMADPYRIQQPRYERDLPDHTIENVSEILELQLD